MSGGTCKKCGGTSQGHQKAPGKQQELSDRELQEKQREGETKDGTAENAEPRGSEQVPNTGVREAPMPDSEAVPGKLVEKHGCGDWGRLPKRVVEEMYDNGRYRLPVKYRVLLENYYRNLPKD